MVLAKEYYPACGEVSQGTLYSLHSQKKELNDYRFAKIESRLYIICDDYKHPFTSKITSLLYRAIEIYGTEYSVIKTISKRTGLSFSCVKGLLLRMAFKNPKKAKLIIETLEGMCKEGLF